MSSKTYEITVEDGELLFVEGDSFHVDDEGNLYIRIYKETEQMGGNEHVAVFVTGFWRCIRIPPKES